MNKLDRKRWQRVYIHGTLVVFFIDNLEHASWAASTSDNNQVKAAGKDYVNVKPV